MFRLVNYILLLCRAENETQDPAHLGYVTHHSLVLGRMFEIISTLVKDYVDSQMGQD